MNNPSLQARAEMGLLQALNQERKSTAKTKVIGKFEVPPKEVMLRARKAHEKHQKLRSEEEDRDIVASLHHQPIDPHMRHKEFPKLARKRIMKRTTHDSTVKQFETTLVEISDILEVKVIEASREVQRGIAGVDQAIQDIFAELNQDLWLVRKEHQYVLDQWNNIHIECGNRAEEIAKYGERLEGIEGERATMVARELRTLVETLSATAFKSRTDIERLVEGEAFELNTVLIVNRQSHAELLALMEKAQIIVAMEARMNWEVRQSAWRQLRHDRCVREFHADLTSKAYMNPQPRIELFARMQQAQAVRHETRIANLQVLTRMKLPESGIVATAVKKFQELNGAEDAAISELDTGLESIRKEREGAAQQRREALRAELHVYGALEDEPDLEAHAMAIENVLTDPELDSFFRGAGGLKPELKELMTELRDPDLIYDARLQPTIKRVQVLICGLEVPDVLETQGKSGMRSNVIDTLERLKNATKGDVPPILPVLVAQVNEILTVTILDPLLLMNVQIALEDLEVIVSDLGEKSGGGFGRDGKSQTGTERTGKSRGGSSSKPRSSKAPSTAGKRSNSRGASRARSSAGGGGGGWEQPEVNMLEVRAVQKRLMMLMRSSDLAPDFQEELRGVLQSLNQKVRCNTAIDAVVEEESVAPLASRDSEYRELSDAAIGFLERNTRHVHEVSVRLGMFFKDLAVILETHSKNDEEIDLTAEDDLFELAEGFKEQDTMRESQVTHWESKLRHAADEGELDEAYEAVLKLLDEVYASYYSYHANGTAAAGQHPIRIATEAHEYMEKLCGGLGLYYDTPNATPPEDLQLVGHYSIRGSKIQYGVERGPSEVVAELMRPPDDEEEDEDDADEEEDDEEGGDGAADGDGALPAAEENAAEAEGGEDGADEEGSVAATEEPEDWEVPWWAEDFEPLDDEAVAAMSDVEREAYLDKRDEAFIKLSSEDREELPTQKRRLEYKSIRTEIKERRVALRAAKEEMRIALYLAPPPLDPDGIDAAMSVMLPASTMESMITALRDSLISHSEARGSERKTFGDELCSERQTDYTEELEERLRLHWPRKGRVEVKIRQVREGQLIAHRQRAQRHGRVVREKNSIHQKEFDELIESYSERCNYYVDELKHLESTLPAQESLAALQGQEGKCKKKVQGFREECEEALEELSLSVSEQPHKLFQLSASLLKATFLFGSNNGDYSEFEYQELQGQLAVLDDEVRASVQARDAQIEALKERQATALAGEAQFMAAFEDSLQELSLREAIGMKYGAPRRNAQERLRTEQTCDANSADAVDVLLNQLETLCKETLSAVHEASMAMKAGKKVARGALPLVTSPPRSAVIRENLKALRVLLFRRAQYLEFLPAPDSIAWEEEVAGEPSLSHADRSGLKKAVQKFVPTLAETMHTAVEQMEERCRVETRELYEQEGKEDTLGPSGVPDALQEWLTKSRQSVLGEGGYRDSSRKRLRDQVERLELLVAKTPVPPDPQVLGGGAAIIVDSSARALNAAAAVIRAREKSFQTQLTAWDAAKTKHHSMLRPQMGRPDAAKDLEALCEAEASRCAEVKQAIVEVKKELVDGQVGQGKTFVAGLAEQCTSALKILDTIIIVDDLGYLPGDEFIEKKRKSLKRLKKLDRTQAVKDEGGAEDGEAQAEERNVPDSYQPPDGRHCVDRTWKPIQVVQMRQIFEKHSVEVNVEEGAESDWIDQLQSTFGGEGPQSIVTTAHRQVIRARDDQWTTFIGDLDANFTRLDQYFGRLLDEECAWEETWKGLVEALVNDNRESEK